MMFQQTGTNTRKQTASRGAVAFTTLVVYLLTAGMLHLMASADIPPVNTDIPLVPYVEVIKPTKPVVATTPPPKSGGGKGSGKTTERVASVDRIADALKIPTTVSAVPSGIPERPRGVYHIGKQNVDLGGNLPVDGVIIGGTDGKPRVPVEYAPTPPPKPSPTPAKKIVVSKGVITGSALSLPQPRMSAFMQASNFHGKVTVMVELNEAGSVTSASATSGHPAFRLACEEAARRAKFKPTLLSGIPVGVKGIIIYEFQ